MAMTGLCSTTSFDFKYTWWERECFCLRERKCITLFLNRSREPLVGGMYSFRGYTDSNLFYEEENKRWRLQVGK